MKKLILFTSILFTLNIITPKIEAQNNKPVAGFTINLTAENAGKDWIYLTRAQNGIKINIDSVKTGLYPVVFKGKLDVPEMLYLRITGSNTLIPVFTENSTFKVFADFNDPAKTKVEGSAVHTQFDSYNAGLIPVSDRQSALSKEWQNAQKAKDEAKLTELEKKFDQLDKEEMDYNRNFVLMNKGSFVAPYVIRKSMFYTLEVEELKSLVNSLDKSVSGSIYYKDLVNKISVLEKVAVGQKFTDINLPGTDGKIVNLSDYVGKGLILVDFWASWCGPCRRENPNVVKLYGDFHSKGFDIVGVSFDTDSKAWNNAIRTDSLAWHQMSDLKGWNSKAAELYGVASIPHTVLLDKNGIIIAKNLHGEELRKRIADLLD